MKNEMRKYYPDFYINRIIHEWLTHEKLIIACDVDDTLIPYNTQTEVSCRQTVSLLKKCQKEGIILIINTGRETSELANTLLQVEELGLTPHAINCMPLSLKHLPYGKSGKVYANIFLDDRAGLQQTQFQLETALKIVKEERNRQKIKKNYE